MMCGLENLFLIMTSHIEMWPLDRGEWFHCMMMMMMMMMTHPADKHDNAGYSHFKYI